MAGDLYLASIIVLEIPEPTIATFVVTITFSLYKPGQTSIVLPELAPDTAVPMP